MGEEKKKMMVQESIYGVNAKTIAKNPIRGGNRTLKQVKRLQHDSKVVPGKSFASAKNPNGKLTPGSKRRALRERNETYVSGSHMPNSKATIASVTGNIFQGSEDVASSTLRADQ